MTTTKNALLTALAALDRFGSHLTQCEAVYWNHRNELTYKVGDDGALAFYTGKACTCGLQAAKDNVTEAL